MWLVRQANSLILEVKVDPNAIGQQCLEKVRHVFITSLFLFSVFYIIPGTYYNFAETNIQFLFCFGNIGGKAPIITFGTNIIKNFTINLFGAYGK